MGKHGLRQEEQAWLPILWLSPTYPSLPHSCLPAQPLTSCIAHVLPNLCHILLFSPLLHTIICPPPCLLSSYPMASSLFSHCCRAILLLLLLLLDIQKKQVAVLFSGAPKALGKPSELRAPSSSCAQTYSSKISQ